MPRTGRRTADPLAHRAFRALLRANGRAVETLRAALRPRGLTVPQFAALRSLGDDALSLGDLSDHLLCSNSNATRLVDGLAERGWVQRVEDPGDRRVTRIQVTPSGRVIRESAAPDYDQVVREVMRRLSPQAQRALAEQLEHLAGESGR